MSHSTCTVTSFMITDCVLNFLYYLRGYYLLFFNLVNSWIDWFSFIFGWLKSNYKRRCKFFINNIKQVQN